MFGSKHVNCDFSNLEKHLVYFIFIFLFNVSVDNVESRMQALRVDIVSLLLENLCFVDIVTLTKIVTVQFSLP